MSFFFVGIDWAARSHELCAIDGEGAVVLRFGFAHSERGIGEALAHLAELSQAGELPVAIERPSGLLVERLLEVGHPVVPMHPNAFAAARSRWRAAGAKSDPADAFKLAD
jgi:transposase